MSKSSEEFTQLGPDQGRRIYGISERVLLYKMEKAGSIWPVE